MEAAEDLFGLAPWESPALFAAGGQHRIAGLTHLDKDATPKAVAKNIRKFVALKQKERVKK